MRGEERRGTLRKVTGRWEQPMIREYLNGATHRIYTVSITEYIGYEKRTRGTETSKYPKERKSNETPVVVASESGLAERWQFKNQNGMERPTGDSDSLVWVERVVIYE